MNPSGSWGSSIDPIEEKLRHVDHSTSEALQFDSNGQSKQAIEKYRIATDELDLILQGLNPSSQQHISLKQHQRSIKDRIFQLEENLRPRNPLPPSPNATPPPGSTYDQASRTSQLAQSYHSNTSSSSHPPQSTSTLATAGVLGGVGGALLLGPIGLVAGGALAAYCATRDDTLGQAARGVSQTTYAGVEKLRQLDDKHNLSGHAKDAAKATVDAAKKMNEDYKITEKLTSSAGKVWTKVRQVEEDYQVSEKVATGVSQGFRSLGNFVKKISDNVSGKSSGSTPPSTGLF